MGQQYLKKMTWIVISSMFSSYRRQASTAFCQRICTASSALFRMKAGVTKLSTYSFEMNSQSPSEATTINLSSMLTQHVTYGSLMTPTVEATQSPKDRVIARPGMFFSLIQIRKGPICSPSSSKQGKTRPPFILIRQAYRQSSAL